MFPWKHERGRRPERPEPPASTHVIDKFVQAPDGWRMVRMYADSLHAGYGTYWQEAFAGPETLIGMIDSQGIVYWSFDFDHLAELKQTCGMPAQSAVTTFRSRNQQGEPSDAGHRWAHIAANGAEPGHVDNARQLVTMWYQTGADQDMTLRIIAEHRTPENGVDMQILFDNGTLRDFGRAFRLETSGY